MTTHKKAADRADGEAAHYSVLAGHKDSSTITLANPAYHRALRDFYGADDAAELATAGLTVARHNAGRHWIISGRGVRLHHWPSSAKWQAFGRVWRSSVEAVIRDIRQGRICMPKAARKAKCRECDAGIWWLKSHKGRWIPLEADGDTHMSRCRP